MRNSICLALSVWMLGCTWHTSPTPRSDEPDAGGGAYVATIAAPRPVAPISVSRLTSRRPTFRWKLASASDGARVEVFSDRACQHPIATFDATGDHGSPSQDLPPGVVFWRLRGMAEGAVGAPTSSPWEAVVPARSAPIATSWGAVLDGNGDGFADVVVGDENASATTQHVYVHAGGPNGPSKKPTSVLSASRPAQAYASSIASAGDIDGDGYGDLLIGSPYEDTVYVYRGGPSGFAEPATVLLRGVVNSRFGTAVSAAGDVNGDGYGDVVIGSPALVSPSGMKVGGAQVFFGGPDGLTPARTAALTPPPGMNRVFFGQFVSTAGDVDGDGLADVAVWAGVLETDPDPMQVAIYRGHDAPFGATPSVLLQYEGADVSWLGDSFILGCAGDVNGDGYTDVMISTVAGPSVKYVIDHVALFYGGPSGPSETESKRILTPLGPKEPFGLAIAAADVNGDGFADIGVAALSQSSKAVAFQSLGGAAGPSSPAELDTADRVIEVAREIASPGDIDGDGYSDWVVSFPARPTPSADDAGVLRGAVDVYRGGPMGASTLPAWTLLPPDTTVVSYGGSIARP